MANMNVTYEELRGTAGQLRNGQTAIMDQLTNLSTQVNNLVASGFVTDQASGKFQQSYEEFTTGAKQAIEGIEGMASFLEQAAQTLQDTDQQLASGI
ncbi:WXG100 family type VII secretion target [Promicromonospora citrea]|uniref:WXG100 family type VII secretion target n=1 Tax=Promicromonospora citrea TaxID=43677 RepID=UPI001489B004|nr:WXG100 family type VII secretion target [Promicromonospora citrea]NNH51341.1 WXG100 family type VII secretion target [Promicromonospora citrea]NNH51343.1 WXG100 family type VII secretion target [Promicromonospora citrea]